MANNYTEFSVALPKVDPAQLALFMDELETEDQVAQESGDWDACPLVGVSCSLSDGELWLHADMGEGDVDKAVALIQKFLVRFNISGGIYMSWASYCSKPRINEAFGGAVVVTGTDCMWTDSFTLIHEATEQGIKILNGPCYE